MSLEWILIHVMRGSWQPQGPVWGGGCYPWSTCLLIARQPAHTPDWWGPGPELQTCRPTPAAPPTPTHPLPQSLHRQSATCQVWDASNGPLPTQSLAVITRHTAMDGWAGTDLSDPLREREGFFFGLCFRVCVSMCVRPLSNYSVFSCFFFLLRA